MRKINPLQLSLFTENGGAISAPEPVKVVSEYEHLRIDSSDPAANLLASKVWFIENGIGAAQRLHEMRIVRGRLENPDLIAEVDHFLSRHPQP